MLPLWDTSPANGLQRGLPHDRQNGLREENQPRSDSEGRESGDEGEILSARSSSRSVFDSLLHFNKLTQLFCYSPAQLSGYY